MNDFLNWLNEVCEKAYITIPAVLTLMTTVIVPALVSIAKIVKSNGNSDADIKRLNNKQVNEHAKNKEILVNQIAYYNDEINFIEASIEFTYNSKEKELKLQRVEILKQQKAQSEEQLNKYDLEPVEEKDTGKKVKVRIVKKAE